MTTNRTHQARLARALAAIAGIRYQTALAQVLTAAEAGQLPICLDTGGMRRALDILLAAPTQPTPEEAALEPRYYRLRELPGMRLPTAVAAKIEAARTRGVSPAHNQGPYDPIAALAGWEVDISDLTERWWRRIFEAGPRDQYALPCPYPPESLDDGYLPIDHVLDDRERTGDMNTYANALRAILRAEPRDIDAHAHLGHLHLAMADPNHPHITITPEPSERERRGWLRKALGHYQAGVGIAELSMADPFHGILTWGELDNRPFGRAQHGLGLALWRLGNFAAAELVLHNMLWLNPLDNQGATALLPAVQAGQPWDEPDEPDVP